MAANSTLHGITLQIFTAKFTAMRTSNLIHFTVVSDYAKQKVVIASTNHTQYCVHHMAAVCNVSKELFTFLFQNEDNLKSSDTPDLNDLTQLLAVIMQHLPESHQDYQLTAHMVDTVQAFISSSKSRSVT
jgi:hypothetical protein